MARPRGRHGGGRPGGATPTIPARLRTGKASASLMSVRLRHQVDVFAVVDPSGSVRVHLGDELRGLLLRCGPVRRQGRRQGPGADVSRLISLLE